MKSRNHEAQRAAAEAARTQSQIRLNALCKGFGAALAESGSSRWEFNEVPELVRLVNTELVPALKAAEAAAKAYEPFWSTRRRRYRPRKKQRPKTANAKRGTRKRTPEAK
jgi:hypothetical protein